MRLANGIVKRITTAYRARDLKRHQLRFAASFSRSSNPSMYGIRRPIGGAIRYRQSRRNDESRFESLNCRLCWATRRHADQKSRVWWRSGVWWPQDERGRCCNRDACTIRERFMRNIAKHSFMPPMARTMIVLGLAEAREARARR